MTLNNDVAIQMGGHRTVLNDPSRRLRRWWIVVTTLLLFAIFTEAVFAGAMLSGVDWARSAHAANAIVLIASTITAGVVAIITLRRVPHGLRLALSLVALAVLVFAQAALGALSARGANLLWVHVPLGAGLLSFATQAVVRARNLCGE